MESKTVKIPKTIKLQWRNSQRMGSGMSCSLVVLGGELGTIGRVNTDTWKYEPWANVKSSVNDFAITNDDTLVAVSTGGLENSHIEIRNASGEILKTLSLPWNARIIWSPNNKLLFVKIEMGTNSPNETCGIYNIETGNLQMVELGKANSIVGIFLDDSNVLVSIKNPEVEGDKHLQTGIISIKENGSTELKDFRGGDMYHKIARLRNNNLIVQAEFGGWMVINDKREMIAKVPVEHTEAVTVADNGFVILSRGTFINYFNNEGKLLNQQKAKKRVNYLTAAKNCALLYENATPNAIVEIMPLVG